MKINVKKSEIILFIMVHILYINSLFTKIFLNNFLAFLNDLLQSDRLTSAFGMIS